MEKKNKKIVVGLSGGIDSAVALLLLKKQGWQPVGISLKLPVWENKSNPFRENTASLKKSLAAAKKVCEKLNIPYHLVNAQKEFRKEVIGYFLKELKKDRTPNPCMICNPHLKFFQLFAWAKKHKIDYVATGHYARIRKNSKTGKYQLLRAKDKQQDQSYYLALLPEKWLKNIVFPLGNYSKQEIYSLARKEGLKFLSKEKPSQDFCFLAGKSFNSFLTQEIGQKPGLIKDEKGKVLGKHKGLHFYTIGQRKGINLSGGPYFVKDFDIKNNILVVTKDKKDLLKKTVLLSSVHLISDIPLRKPIEVKAKIRYRQPLAKATFRLLSRNKAKLVFDKPQRAVTPGQFAVIYQGDICLGGGKIEE